MSDLIAAEVDRLLDLLNMQLRRARHRPEGLETVDLAQLIGGLVMLLKYQMPDTISLRAELPESLPARLPPNGLRQAVFNLLRKAQQALARRGGIIRVSSAERGANIEICVEDDGPGFADPLLSDGVRRFMTTWEGGTGLGLAMVRRFAQDLGGRLELTNRDQGGACARIIVPAAADGTGQQAESRS
jgi:nitrogen fixation/metabolism regulation signal transduction histidine kinase